MKDFKFMTRAHEETSKLENTLSSVWLLYLEVKLQQATYD